LIAPTCFEDKLLFADVSFGGLLATTRNDNGNRDDSGQLMKNRTRAPGAGRKLGVRAFQPIINQ
jgi:hypothetical protein